MRYLNDVEVDAPNDGDDDGGDEGSGEEQVHQDVQNDGALLDISPKFGYKGLNGSGRGEEARTIANCPCRSSASRTKPGR